MTFAILNLLKPASHIPTITDQAVIKKTYQYWRVRTFYSMYVGYLFYYFTRKSFTFITPFLSADLQLSKSDIGLLASVLSITYGISKFTSGILCDRSNPRYFMAIGLILTGICNILFGFSSSIFLFAVFWGLNGWFQGWGWPACTKQLTHWFGRKERGSWWSAATTSHTVGGFLIAYLSAYCASLYGWRFGMFIPGVLCIVVGFWLLNRLRDVPQSLGLPPIEKFKGEDEEVLEEDNSSVPTSIKKILFQHVLNNKYVWILSISYFFVYVVRMAVNDWGTVYLVEMKNYNRVAAAACISWFEVGGFFGILVAGWGSDYWFEGKRVPLAALGFFGLVFSIAAFWYLAPQQLFLASFLVSLIGFLVSAPQMLVGLAAAEFVSKKAASTANGFAGFFASVGAAAAGYPLGVVIDLWGWYEFMVILLACSVAGLVVLLPIWSAKTGASHHEEIDEHTQGLVSRTS